jgi:hypothetical protein
MELCDRKFRITQEIERERERERVKGFCKAAQNVQTATNSDDSQLAAR